jgi:hypothetical protein
MNSRKMIAIQDLVKTFEIKNIKIEKIQEWKEIP